MECERIFVYGTLRRGQTYRPRIEELIETSRAATVRARMYHFAPAGSRGEFPFIVAGSGTVRGEVLAFRDFARALAVLDEIEECPELYVRRTVEVKYDDGSTGRAQAYFIRPGEERQGLPVESGDWVQETGGEASG